MSKTSKTRTVAKSLTDLKSIAAPRKTRILNDLTQQDDAIVAGVIEPETGVDFDTLNEPAADAVSTDPVTIAAGGPPEDGYHYVVTGGTSDVLDGPFASRQEADAYLTSVPEGTYFDGEVEVIDGATLDQRDAERRERLARDEDEDDSDIELIDDSSDEDRSDMNDGQFDDEADAIEAEEEAVRHIMNTRGVDEATARGLFETGVEESHNHFSDDELDRMADDDAIIILDDPEADDAEGDEDPDDRYLRETVDVAVGNAPWTAEHDAMLQAACDGNDEINEQYTDGMITKEEALAKSMVNGFNPVAWKYAANKAKIVKALDDFPVDALDPSLNPAAQTGLIGLSPAAVEAYTPNATVTAAPVEEDEGMDANMANMTREQAIAEIRAFYKLTKTPGLETLWAQMDEARLFDLLHMLRANNGGSLDMATLLQQVRDRYTAYLTSPQMQDRMKLLNAKASDQLRVFQALEKMAGRDFTIGGASFSDYHNMLKGAVGFVSSITDAAYALADKLHLTLPLDEMQPNGAQLPIVEGMPADPRIVLFILEVFYAQLDKLQIHRESCEVVMKADAAKIERLSEQLRASNAARDEAHKRVDATNAMWRERLSGEEQFFIRDMAKGGYLRKTTPADVPLKSLRKDLDLRGTADTCWKTAKRTSAFELARRLQEAYPAREFQVFRISVVAERA